jgi:hypothetical protein
MKNKIDRPIKFCHIGVIWSYLFKLKYNVTPTYKNK